MVVSDDETKRGVKTTKKESMLESEPGLDL